MTDPCRIKITNGPLAGLEASVLSESMLNESQWIVKVDGLSTSHQYWEDEFEVLSGTLESKKTRPAPRWIGDTGDR